MNEINPYYQWFGIAKEIQSPNHYQLLGLIDQNCDSSAIEAAYQTRLEILTAFDESPHSETAHRLKAQIALARSTLSNASSREKYDQQIGAGQVPPPLSGENVKSNGPNSPQISTAKTVATSPAPKVSNYRSRRTQRSKTNMPLQIGLFFIPTLILIIILTVFPGTFTSMTRGIRNLVYGAQTEDSSDPIDDAQSGNSGFAKREKVKPTRGRMDKQRAKTLDKLAPSAKGKNRTISVNDRPSKSGNPGQPPATDQAAQIQLSNQANRQRPPRHLIDAYLERFKSLPVSDPLQLFELAVHEKDLAKKFAIFEFGMEVAKKKARIGELVEGIRLWTDAFDVDWEKEFLARLLEVSFSNRSTVASAVSWSPSILSGCRQELCLKSGVQFCDLMLSHQEILPRINLRFFQTQKSILQQMQGFDRAPDSTEKQIFETLFFDGSKLKKTDLSQSEFLKQLIHLNQILAGNRNLTSDALFGEFETLKELSATIKSSAKYPATSLLIDEVLNQMEVKTKLVIIKSGIDWTDKSNLRFQLEGPQVCQPFDLKSQIPLPETTTPVVIRHRTSFTSPFAIQDFGYCGDKSRLIVYGQKSFFIMDPVSRKSIELPAFTQPGYDEVAHPVNYLSVAFNGRSIIWRDLFSGEKLTERLQLATTTSPAPVGRIPFRFKRIAILNKRNDIVALNGTDLVRIHSPTHSAEKRLQEKLQSGLTSVQGIHSNCRNGVAVLANNEVTLIEDEKVKRRINVNQPINDFIFSQSRNQYYVATNAALVKVSEEPIVRIDISNLIYLEEIDARHLIVCQKVGASTFLNKLIALEKTPTGENYRVLQTMVADTPTFRLSSDKKSLVFKNRGQLEVYSVL